MMIIQLMKLTGAAILVSRGMKVLQAGPAVYPYRSGRRSLPATGWANGPKAMGAACPSASADRPPTPRPVGTEAQRGGGGLNQELRSPWGERRPEHIYVLKSQYAHPGILKNQSFFFHVSGKDRQGERWRPHRRFVVTCGVRGSGTKHIYRVGPLCL
jgi:hypothetical protein